MILVTGATGTVGSQVLTCLLPDHAGEVRALTRNPDAVFPAGVEKVVGDLGSGDLSSLLRGVVFLLSDGLLIADHDRQVATTAASAGVQRIVKLSAFSVGHGSTDPITTWHRTAVRPGPVVPPGLGELRRAGNTHLGGWAKPPRLGLTARGRRTAGRRPAQSATQTAL